MIIERKAGKKAIIVDIPEETPVLLVNVTRLKGIFRQNKSSSGHHQIQFPIMKIRVFLVIELYGSIQLERENC